MQYMLLIYDNEKVWQTMGDKERNALMGEYFAFTEALKKKRQLSWPATRCSRRTTATTVRVRDGKRLTTDGPFAETKEQLGGYYLVNAKDLDEAIAIAAQIPACAHRARSRCGRS